MFSTKTKHKINKNRRMVGRGDDEIDVSLSTPLKNSALSQYTISENFHNLVQKSLTLVLDSDTRNGAFNKSPDGSRFSVELKNNLEIPANAENVSVKVHRVYIWNTFDNITSTNNQITVTGQDTLGVVQTKTITIDDGLYTPSQLNDELLEKLKDAGFKQTPDPVISLYPDIPKGKIVMKLNYNDSAFTFVGLAPFNDIIGFENRAYNVPTDGTKILGTNNASFNTNDYILVKSNICGGEGVLLNDVYSDIIAVVPISSTPYSQIQATIDNPIEIDANLFKGPISTRLITTQITNQNGVALNTQNENYQISLQISWLEKKY